MKTNVNIKVDENIRDEVKDLFNQMGLDMTTAVNMFFLASLREKGLPFAVTTLPNAKSDEEVIQLLINKLKVAEQQEKAGQMREFDDFSLEMKNKYGRR